MKNKKKISASEQRTLWGSRVVIWITMIVVLFPVIWIVMSSFSAGDSFFLSSLFPEKFSIEHYVELFRETDFGIWVFNSLKFCFIVAIIQLVLTSLAAYAFARLRFVGRKYGLMALLILQVFPNSMAVAGYYILIYKFGLVDNSFALILVLAGGSAYNIWLLKSYIDGLPVELDEAAMVDGANEFQVFYKIIIPLAMPQLAVIFLFSFIATYSEYVITSIFLQTTSNSRSSRAGTKCAGTERRSCSPAPQTWNCWTSWPASSNCPRPSPSAGRSSTVSRRP